ncbi:MAG: type II secretion system protein [Candidatus Nealsonbacteria bacterium]
MKAFTLIEVLVTIAVFVLIFGAVSGFIVMLYRTQGYTWQQSMAINEARKGIETMVKEIREAKIGDDGSFPIEKASDKEFIFYSDIDKDGETERVRYFLGGVSSGEESQECEVFSTGGTCGVVFSDFFQGEIKTAQVQVSVDGDFGWNNREYVDIEADGNYLGRICRNGCSDCLGYWQGIQTYDVLGFAADNQLSFLADASSYVDPVCPFAMKVKFDLSWEEETSSLFHQFKKGVINPVGSPAVYPSDQEEVSVLSFYVRNAPPIFEYFDAEGNKIEDSPSRLKDTKLMKVYLVVDVNEERSPQSFELESFVQIRNLK